MKIFFFIQPDVIYDDNIAYLAEGLNKLHYKLYGSKNYWHNVETNKILVRQKKIEEQKWDLLILTHTAYQLDTIVNQKYFVRKNAVDTNFLKKHAKKIILINSLDGVNFLGENDANIKFIFRSQFNKKINKSSKTLPYVLGGYQERIKKYTPLKIKNKIPKVLDSFGFTHHYEHQQRKFFRTHVIPLLNKNGIEVVKALYGSLDIPPHAKNDKIWWEMTGGKHNPAYFNAMSLFYANACFCGEMVSGLPKNPLRVLQGGNRAKATKIIYKLISKIFKIQNRLVQWDSWRFWETLAMKSVPLMCNLEEHGVELPVMPKNYQHYIGLDPNNINESIKKMQSVWKNMPDMAEDSFEWLKLNYSSEVNATRILEKIK